MTATIIERIKLSTAWAIGDATGVTTDQLRVILNEVRGEPKPKDGETSR